MFQVMLDRIVQRKQVLIRLWCWRTAVAVPAIMAAALAALRLAALAALAGAFVGCLAYSGADQQRIDPRQAEDGGEASWGLACER